MRNSNGTTNCIYFDGIKIEETHEFIEYQDKETSTREISSGKGGVYIVESAPDLLCKVVHIFWENGKGEVHCLKGCEPAIKLSRLIKGLRMTIYPEIKSSMKWMELSLAMVTSLDSSENWANTYKANIDEISRASRVDASNLLKKFGAENIGRKSILRDQEGKRSNYLCVLFHRDNHILPVICYTIARILPLYHEHGSVDLI